LEVKMTRAFLNIWKCNSRIILKHKIKGKT
jgi:hypothetical protein